VSGKPVKAINQLYNKQREHIQKQLAKGKEPRYTSRRLDRITTKRSRRVLGYLHTASRRIIDLLVEEGIGMLVLGKNPFWKTGVELGKKHNQEFVQIPHAQFLELLIYKAEARGIQVLVTEESYTSRASFLDLDPLPTYDPSAGVEQEDKPHFSGRRDGRWYRVKGRAPIHADVNGSFNIGRKVFPTAFRPGIAATAVRPRRLAALKLESHGSSVMISGYCEDGQQLCLQHLHEVTGDGPSAGNHSRARCRVAVMYGPLAIGSPLFALFTSRCRLRSSGSDVIRNAMKRFYCRTDNVGAVFIALVRRRAARCVLQGEIIHRDSSFHRMLQTPSRTES
jgi:IS605 OrfB family transposase